MRLSWGIADRAEYALTSLRLAILDKICGPEPLTQADEVRERRRKRLKRHFLKLI
jgi:hypothetical protein